jgi:dTDP-4-amino-4,6-dideoxygalactose transaminase/spore coat polysaccharide biosynthesis protein SpsF (cytidylyltransferase family)
MENTPSRPFIPYAKPSIGDEEINEVVDTLRKGWLTTGKKTQQFEDNFKQYVGTPFALAVNSCTAALHLALIVAGVKEGDEVITTPLTFAATGEVILYLKAKPIFVDVDPETYNLDPSKIEEKITSRTKAILPVHFAGLPCEMDAIIDIAKKYNLKVIEDAAHAVGSLYKGKKIGTIGDITTFSFYATKNLATGEGGMITSMNQTYQDPLTILRLHGLSKDAWKRYTGAGSWRYEILEQGYKYNLSDIHSSLGIHQLAKLDSFNKTRQVYSSLFDNAFSSIPEITLQKIEDYMVHSRHLYPIQVDFSSLCITRDEFIEILKEKQIGTSVHFIPLHMHRLYQNLFNYAEGDFPVSEKISDNIVSLPLYPEMSEEEVGYVSNTVSKIIEESRIPLKKPKVVAIVAARMNSTRMYGKPMKLVTSKSIIELCIERLKTCSRIDEIVIATSDKEENKVFFNLAEKLGVRYYVGDEEDVLDRFHKCALTFGADHIVRATSENPLMYIENLAGLIEQHIEKGSDFSYTDKLPLGCFVEVISRTALQKSCKFGENKHHSELVTLFINENKDQFIIHRVEAQIPLQRMNYRLTVDTELDLKLMRLIYQHFENGEEYIPLQDAVTFLDQNPELVEINSSIPVGEARVWK